MKFLLCAATCIATLTMLCCGSGPPITPPPPSGPFSNASLKGQYAFSISGLDLKGAYFAQVGSFTADGDGNITAGLEDVLDLGSGQPATLVSFTGGSYAIQENGKGTVTLQAASGSALQLTVGLQSNSAGYLLQTATASASLAASSSGTFNLQTSADFSAATLAYPYVFDLSGVSFSASNTVAPISMVGQILTNGGGDITGGVMDTDDGNQTGPSGATAVEPGTYQLDSNGNGTNFGRGMMTFNGRTYAFYIVDPTHLKMLEEDTLGGSTGDALQQAASVPVQNSQFTGSFVYMTAGAAVTGTKEPLVRAARFTADGNGDVGAISLDSNYGGNYTHISQGSNISAATYAIDTTNAGSGRGTFTFKASGVGTFLYVFYLISGTQAVVQESTAGLIGGGPMYAQTAGPFTVSGSAGSYVFNWTGEQLGSSTAVPLEEDFVGEYTLSSATSSNIAGAIDYVEIGITGNSLFTNVGLGGTLTINGDGTANNLYKFVVGGTSATTVNFQAYFVNSQTVLAVSSDNNRTMVGVLNQQ